MWRDLMTTDLERSKAFLLAFFDWETEEYDMGEGALYTMFKVPGESTFGGIVELDPDHGLPSHWMSYVSTEDVDDFCARASDMGATISVEPTDIPDIGRFAVVADPQGANISVMSELDRTVTPTPMTIPPGHVVWNELMTSDVDAATAFYTRMFDWSSQVADVGTGPYTLMMQSETPIAGIMARSAEMPVSSWGIYFEVADADAAAAKAAELGAEVLMPTMDVPTVGKLVWISEPAGAMFGLMQSAPM